MTPTIAKKSKDAFRIHFTDTLLELISPGDLQAAAARLLGEYMGVNRAGFVDIDKTSREVIIAHTYTYQVAPVEGIFRYEDFGTELLAKLQRKQINVINNVNTHEGITEEQKNRHKALQIQAAIYIPILCNGELKAVLFIHKNNQHQWTSNEISFYKEMTQRAWDVIGRARAEEALRKSEEKYYQLFNAIDEGYCVIEVLFNDHNKPIDYRFLEVNAAFERQTGIVHAAGKRMRAIAPDHEQHWFDRYGHIALTGEPMQFENEAKELGYYYDVYAFRIGAPAERKVAIRFNDISVRKAAEKQQEDFISIASHELKTPVTSIKVYAEVLQHLLQEKGCTIETGYMRSLNEQVNRLIQLINSLLDTTKINSQMPLHLQTFNLNDLIAVQQAAMQLVTATHSIVFHPAPADVLVMADKERISQVLINLISNAIKYSPGGEKKIEITCENAGNDNVLVSVRDYGIGIPANMKEKVFERFFRTQHAQLKGYPGIGLGLYISAGIIRRHGGKIWVESEEGKGSTFYFTLPCFKPAVL